jgi:hypothetical protein
MKLCSLHHLQSEWRASYGCYVRDAIARFGSIFRKPRLWIFPRERAASVTDADFREGFEGESADKPPFLNERKYCPQESGHVHSLSFREGSDSSEVEHPVRCSHQVIAIVIRSPL